MGKNDMAIKREILHTEEDLKTCKNKSEYLKGYLAALKWRRR